MRVFAVIETYFNGEGDSDRVAGMYSSYEKAKAAAKSANEREQIKSGFSSYASTFDAEMDGVEIDAEIIV